MKDTEMDYDKIISECKDTVELIFDYRFMIRMPHQESRGLGNLRQFGTRMSDLSELNNSVQKEMRTCYLTINEMVEQFKGGVTVTVVKESDTKVIYQFIVAHLEGWKTRMARSINASSAPFEDLILLDEFASKIYVHARHIMRDKGFIDLIQNQLSPGQLFTARSLFSDYDPETHRVVEKTPLRPGEREQFPVHQEDEFFKGKLLAQSAFGARRGR